MACGTAGPLQAAYPHQTKNISPQARAVGSSQLHAYRLLAPGCSAFGAHFKRARALFRSGWATVQTMGGGADGGTGSLRTRSV